ncbi:hypothetical protein [Brevibacillus agri]|uniref:hypothetical protein n=1 Tax=Brevibacillus agri TaxID=51101 RepID=UPI0004708D4B|nr:hypothetical protein [Brevibacillus agri]MBG9568530.1 hypothetical protein [Brevibacillus agri]
MAARIDFHTHIIPADLPDFSQKYGGDRWPILQPTCSCGANIMVGGKLFREITDQCWDPQKRIADMAAEVVDMQVLDQGWNVWPHLRVTEQPPSFYTKNFYFDSLSYEPLNIRLLLERFGHEMRDTVYCEVKQMDEAAIRQSVLEIVEQVQAYVPGYRLKQEPLFEENRVTVFLEVEGAGDYFPPYAGNLDIMTAAAVRVGEEVARHLLDGRGVSLGTK